MVMVVSLAADDVQVQDLPLVLLHVPELAVMLEAPVWAVMLKVVEHWNVTALLAQLAAGIDAVA